MVERRLRRSRRRRRGASTWATSRAVRRSGVSPAASAICSARSSTCLTQRTKSPGARSTSSSTSSSVGPARPAVGRPGEAEVGLAQVATAGARARPRRARPRSAPSRRARARTGPPGTRGGSASSGLRASKTSADNDRGQLRHLQVVPDAAPQALGGHQVQLAVDPRQRRPGRRHLVAVQVVELLAAPRRRGRTAARSCSCAARSGAGCRPSRARASRSARPSGRGPRGRGTAWHGCARIAVAQPAHLGVVVRPGCACLAEPRSDGRGRSRVRSRSSAARSRRCCGLRALNVLAIRIRVSGSTGVGKSTSDSRRACRSTRHDERSRTLALRPRSPGRSRPRSRTSCRPAPRSRRRPGACRATPPPRRAGRPALASDRSASRSDSARRSPAYSMKSPRSQAIASA